MTEPDRSFISQKRHSRLGIASTVIGLLLPVLFIAAIGAWAVLLPRKGAGAETAETTAMIIFCITLTFPFFHLVGVILGLAGIFSKTTKKLFPALGIVINLLLLSAVAAIILLLVPNLPVKY